MVQQFEEALIDAVQGDAEMGTYMSTYLDARKRLSEKTKNRGFWPNRGKGSGRKGKFKFQGRGRKPLAVRIAESDCRLCGQRGHWKAECPRRTQSGPSGQAAGRAQTANVMISVNQDLDDDEADVYVMAPEMWQPDVLTPTADEDPLTDSRKSHVGVVLTSMGNKGHKSKYASEQSAKGMWEMPYYQQVRNCVSRLMTMTKVSQPAVRKYEPERSSTTPSPENTGDNAVGQTEKPFAGNLSPVRGEPIQVMPPMSSPDLRTDTIMFATAQAVGILDLGASQTVIGQQQVLEFLESLPADVRKLVHERPVEMTFRFGNISVVPCTKALFVPVDKCWIKIAVVESRTPFLISNDVCRSLGAIIDTNRQSIFFRNLNCEMPLQLSGKKLFLLDFCALTAMKPPKADTPVSPENSSMPRSDLILQSHGHEVEGLPRSTENDHHQVQSKESPACVDPAHSLEPSLSDSLPSDIKSGDPQCALSEIHSEPHSHVLRPGRTFRSDADQEGAAPTEPRCDEDVLRGTGTPSDPLRRGQEGTEILRSGCQRSQLLQVVSEEIGLQSQAGTSDLQPLPDAMDRTTRARASGHPSASQRRLSGQFTSLPQSQGSGWNGRWSLLNDDHRSGDRGGGMVGSSDTTSSPSRIGECQAPRPDRRCTERSDRSAQVADSAEAQRDLSVASSSQTFMIEQCIREYNQYALALGHSKFPLTASSSRDPYQENSILQEMIQYGIHRGWIDESGKLLGPQQPGIDVLEVYCSSESQLTGQSIQQGMKAKRFGLQQGNLCYYEGRCKLYEELFRSRPRNVWLSPKCKAWCRWNQFNACKSPEMAQKVIEAQSQDLVHLLICEAVFVFQRDRGPENHCHLEQPVGSEMLNQDVMQLIVEQTIRARCDFCNAGALKHPTNHQFMQKGTQILTTSMIMHHASVYFNSQMFP